MIDREREREPETVIDWYAVVSHSLIRLIWLSHSIITLLTPLWFSTPISFPKFFANFLNFWRPHLNIPYRYSFWCCSKVGTVESWEMSVCRVMTDLLNLSMNTNKHYLSYFL
jgi:hypothetical protein